MKAYELLFIVAPTIDDETRAGSSLKSREQ